MHVAAEQQGRGVGRALLRAALGRARQEPGLALIQLSVGSTNEPAKSLYASFGFETYGIERQAIFVDGEYFDEELMALKLDLPTG
jgi:ribosomal protein S18 acetylase RimI-like enzyme